MVNLVLTVVGLTAFMHIMKYAQARGQRIFAVAAVNYVFAGLLSVVLWCWQGEASWSRPLGGMLLGVIVGAGYVGTFALLHLGIAGSGVSLTTTVTRLSIIIPMLVSLLWDALPNAYQVAGMMLILVSLPLIGARPAANPQASRPPSLGVLALLFLLSGAWQVAMKLVSLPAGEAGGPKTPGPIYSYNLALFVTAALVSSLLAFRLKQAPRPRELASGTMLGGANLLSNVPVLLALQREPGAIVFATRASAAVALTVLLSLAIWGERISRRSAIGIGVAVAALVLVHVHL